MPGLAAAAAVRRAAGAHGVEDAAAFRIGSEAAEAAEGGVGGLLLLIFGMVVLSQGIRLPDFDHAVRDGRAVAIEQAEAHADALAHGFGLRQASELTVRRQREVVERPNGLRRQADE